MKDLYQLDDVYSLAERLYQKSRGSVKLAQLVTEIRRAGIRFERLKKEIEEAELLLSGARIPSSGVPKSDAIIIDGIIRDLKDTAKRLEKRSEEFGESVAKATRIITEIVENPEACKGACDDGRELNELVEGWLEWTSKAMNFLEGKRSLLNELLEKGALKDVEEAVERLFPPKKSRSLLSKILSKLLPGNPPEEGERYQGDVP